MNIEHPNYTLVAYKSDGFSMCYGHINETFSSDFKLHTQMNMDECLAKHAELRLTEYAEDEPEFEITVLYRGVPIAEVGGPIYDLYSAALDQEIEDQKEAIAARAAQAFQEREQAAEQLATSQREAAIAQFKQKAEELGFVVTLRSV
jgi:hypothetical protein